MAARRSFRQKRSSPSSPPSSPPDSPALSKLVLSLPCRGSPNASPQLTAKALPRLDDDERLLPILSHLSMGFMAGITSEYTVPTGGDGEEQIGRAHV